MLGSPLMPDFGPLAGIKVVHSGQATAGPFAAQLLADLGADVLWIENPLTPDLARAGLGLTLQMERRNQRTIALNIPTAAGSKVLLELLRDADVFIESSRGGQYARWNLDDEALWDVNPRLVIVHVSGYGQAGDPSYVPRASFDPIAQAFGCYLQLNGPPEGPLPAQPVTADFMTGVFGAYAALAALHRSRITGEGDSVDVAMFEVMMRVGGGGPMAYLNHGVVPKRADTRRSHSAGMGLFSCADGEDIYVIIGGAGVIKRSLAVLDIDADPALFPSGAPFIPIDSAAGDLVTQRLTDYCAQRTAAEVEEALNAQGIPCSKVYTYADAEHDPHYIARDVFVEWETAAGTSVRGVGVVPKFKNRPGRIWRGGPDIGADTADVLRDAGYTAEQIEELEADGIVSAAPDGMNEEAERLFEDASPPRRGTKV